MLTQLPGDWIMWTEDTTGLDEVLASISNTPNPLGAITTTQPRSVYWSAVALDYAWEVFGVPSLGTRARGARCRSPLSKASPRLLPLKAAAAFLGLRER